MKKHWLHALSFLGLFFSSTSVLAVEYDVDKIIAATRKPFPNLILLCSHRGLWEQVGPENSLQAIEAARAAGVETIEIDVRLANDGTPWLLHDFALERHTNGIGYVSMNQSSTISTTYLRNRNFSLSTIRPVKLEEMLDYFAKHLSLHDNRLAGFVLAIDLKTPPGVDPNAPRANGYEALKKSWDVVKEVSEKYPNLLPPGGSGPALGRAIVFKLRSRNLPAPEILEKDLNISVDTDYFHLEPVLYPDDSTGNTVLNQYFDKHYNVGFEPVEQYFGQEPATGQLKRLKDAGRTIPGYPGWNDYAEGHVQSNGSCCVNWNTDPTKQHLDYSASLEFQLQRGGTWLTADTVMVLDDMLTARGMRDLSHITWTPAKGEKR